MTLPYPDLRFDLHPVRAKSVSWIELLYPCGLKFLNEQALAKC